MAKARKSKKFKGIGKAVEPYQLSEDETKMATRAVCMLSRTWSTIGYDVLQSFVDTGDAKNINGVVLNKDLVIDCVMSCGAMGGYPEMHGGDREACEWFEKQPEVVKQRLLDQAFPHQKYGM